MISNKGYRRISQGLENKSYDWTDQVAEEGKTRSGISIEEDVKKWAIDQLEKEIEKFFSGLSREQKVELYYQAENNYQQFLDIFIDSILQPIYEDYQKTLNQAITDFLEYSQYNDPGF